MYVIFLIYTCCPINFLKPDHSGDILDPYELDDNENSLNVADGDGLNAYVKNYDLQPMLHVL